MRRLAGPFHLLVSLPPVGAFRWVLPALILALPLAAPTVAWGADKKDEKKDEDDLDLGDDTKMEADDFKESEEPDEEPAKRLDEGDKEETDPDNLDYTDDATDKPIDFEDDTTQQSVTARGKGEDTAEIYRDAQKKYSALNSDEEQLRWEQYLQKYPKSLFRDRIEARMEELSQAMFSERVEGSDAGAGGTDAAKRELNFALPQHFANVDPRTHLGGGFELGLPNWFGLRADFEYGITREFSAHAGVRPGLGGTEGAVGARYALIKSTRTGTILSGGLDLNLNTPTVFLGIQPMLSFGQRLKVLDGLDLQAQVAPVIELRNPVGARYFAGFNASLQANDTVAVFVETSNNLKYLADPSISSFTYMVGSFGLKFNAAKGKGDDLDGRLVIDLSANIPYSYHYWSFYQGALQAGVNYYF